MTNLQTHSKLFVKTSLPYFFQFLNDARTINGKAENSQEKILEKVKLINQKISINSDFFYTTKFVVKTL